MARSIFTPPAQMTTPAGETMTWCHRCDRYIAGADMVHVQDYGHADGKRAGELGDGDVILWNFGSMGRVRRVEPASRCYVTVTYEYVDRRTGEVVTGSRRCKPATLLAVETDPQRILRAVSTGRLP